MKEEGNTRKDDLIEAYLNHIHERGEIPDIDSMPAADRRQLETTFKVLDAIAGIDADLVPDLEQDPAAQALGFVNPADARATTSFSPSEAAMIAEIELLNRDAAIARDVEATQVSDSRSYLLLRVEGVRIRLTTVRAGELQDLDQLLIEADRMFFRFPDTSAVGLVEPEDDLLTQLLESSDCRPAIEVPLGVIRPPRPHRPALPLRSALTGYLGDIEPIWDPPGSAGKAGDNGSSAEEIAYEVARDVVRQLSADGTKARTPAKREVWSALGDREIHQLAKVILDVHRGAISGSDLAKRQLEIVRDVA